MRLYREPGKLVFHLPAKGTDAPHRPLIFATAKARRPRKSRKPARASDPRPRPPWSWCVRAWLRLWNCLGFGGWWDFNRRQLLRFYGFSYAIRTSDGWLTVGPDGCVSPAPSPKPSCGSSACS